MRCRCAPFTSRDSFATTSGYKCVVREVLNHRQLSLCKHPHLLEFKEVILTPRYLGEPLANLTALAAVVAP